MTHIYHLYTMPRPTKRARQSRTAVQKGATVQVASSSSSAGSAGDARLRYDDWMQNCGDLDWNAILESSRRTLPMRGKDAPGTSRTTVWRKKKRVNDAAKAAAGSADILSWFTPTPSTHQKAKEDFDTEVEEEAEGQDSCEEVVDTEVEEALKDEDETGSGIQEEMAPDYLSDMEEITDDDEHESEYKTETESIDEEDEPVLRSEISLVDHPNFDRAYEILMNLKLRSSNARDTHLAKAFIANVCLSDSHHRDTVRLLAIFGFLGILRKKPTTSLRIASGLVACAVYGKFSGETAHKARSIRNWAWFFVENFSLPVINKGRNIKTESLIHDEDFKELVMQFVREQLSDKVSRNSFTPRTLTNFIQTRFCKQITENTARRWLYKLDFVQRYAGSGLYFDGHERVDVVAYRNLFVVRMCARMPRMDSYRDGPDGSIIVDPPKDKDVVNKHACKIIPVVHDESTYMTKDGRKKLWSQKGFASPVIKGQGATIMVSGFLCPCHGFFSNGDDRSYKTIEPGKGKDGWWTNADLVAQAEKVTQLFEAVHPGCQALFLFDNSQNHHAAPPTGLCVTNLNKTDGGKNMNRNVRDGWYMKENERVVQPMCHADGIPKGVETILMERGLLQVEPAVAPKLTKKGDFVGFLLEQSDIQELKLDPSKLKLDDSTSIVLTWSSAEGWFLDSDGARVAQKFVHPDQTMKGLRTIVKERAASGSKKMTLQEMRDMLSAQPDFQEQKEWLSETITSTGKHLIDYFPKYHCELSPIEKVWGVSKRYTRGECDFTLGSLRIVVPQSLDAVSVESIQRFFRASFEYMQAYKECKGMSFELVQNARKVYKSHRKVPASL